MLSVITSVDDRLVSLFADDPVRPNIGVEFRCSWPKSCVFVLSNSSLHEAVLCCRFKEVVPSSLEQLLESDGGIVNAIFYSVWSYSRGSGRRIIPLAQSWIRSNRPEVRGFYTFSPPGELVRSFHLGLGARVYRENLDSVNYVY